MDSNCISDWILTEIDALTKENAELIEWEPGMHPHPSAMSNMCRLQKSNACRAKIEAYIKLLDYMGKLKMTNKTFELSITLKGTNKSALRRKLMEIIAEFDDDYGKPRQGIYGEFDVESKISTPIWDGKEY